MSYKEISQRKKAARDALFKPEWLVPEDKLPGPEVKDVHTWPADSGYLSPEEITITESHPLTILANIKDKKWTAYEVTAAFAHRATISHQLINCLTEVFFNEGLAMAKELDEYYEKTGKLKGPYHGLPISLKDNQAVKGIATSCGYTGLADEVCEADSVIAGTLRDLGAVFYVKTNLPTAMMMLESINHVWGTTMNPFNRDLTCGGSSGGEGALVAMRGSAMGIGGDLGGSLRVPGGFQNLFTIKTSSGRWPIWGGKTVLGGFESAMSVNGPLTGSIDMLEMYGNIITNLGLDDVDPKMINYGWNMDFELPEKLTFAVCYDDGVVRPTPPVQRGLKHVVETLRAAGHEVIEWDAEDLHGRLTQLLIEFFVSGGLKKAKKFADMTGEPIDHNIFLEIFYETEVMDCTTLWEKQAERSGIVKKLIEKWAATSKQTTSGKPIDALLMPVSAYPAAGHNRMSYMGYTGIFNGLDWPAGTVPVTRADQEIDLKEEGYTPRNRHDEICYNDYDPVKYHGGPVAVQVVGRTMQDEKVLKMMRVVAKELGTEDYWYKN